MWRLKVLDKRVNEFLDIFRVVVKPVGVTEGLRRVGVLDFRLEFGSRFLLGRSE